MIRHAWLQKHASPTASDGAFHWHPADGDIELRAHLVERARGLEAPAVLWELAPGRVVWAQVFAATAPHDRRRYTGLVVTIVERPGASTTELLDDLVLPAAMPWAGDDGYVSARALRDVSPGQLAPLARSLLDGAASRIAAPVFAALPAAMRALDPVMPAAVRARVRRGAWFVADDGSTADPMALLVARACLTPGSRAARAWRLVCELAASSERSVDDVSAEVWPELEREELASALHAWGRGRRDAMVATRHADAFVLRVIACLAGDRDPAPVLAAVRWHALLPADRRAQLFELALRRCPSMRSVVTGGVHA